MQGVDAQLTEIAASIQLAGGPLTDWRGSNPRVRELIQLIAYG